MDLVLLDGFDLGLGTLFLIDHRAQHRDVMMNTVAPFWDGNETWLVLGGAGLFAAFPLAYATLLPALYIPIMVMLFALIFRGVAFEYRFKAARWQGLWDLSFGIGSTLAAFSQGVMLGGFIGGFKIVDNAFAGGALDWLTPFSIMSGVGLVCGYTLLGATWLIMKTTGDLQDWARAIAKRLMPIMALFMVVVSLWTPFVEPKVAARWFSFPNVILLSPVPIVTAAIFVMLWRAVERRQEAAPFALTIGLFVMAYAGLAISMYPNIIPPGISIWQAASPWDSQLFFLIGIAIMLPIILAYTAYNYWVFRGKVTGDAGYH